MSSLAQKALLQTFEEMLEQSVSGEKEVTPERPGGKCVRIITVSKEV